MFSLLVTKFKYDKSDKYINNFKKQWKFGKKIYLGH